MRIASDDLLVRPVSGSLGSPAAPRSSSSARWREFRRWNGEVIGMRRPSLEVRAHGRGAAQPLEQTVVTTRRAREASLSDPEELDDQGEGRHERYAHEQISTPLAHAHLNHPTFAKS